MTYEIKGTYEPYDKLKKQLFALTAERDRLALELAELKKRIDELEKQLLEARSERNALQRQCDDEGRLDGELAAIKKQIDDAPEAEMFQADDMWKIKLDELSLLFGFGMYKDMKPGETRRFKLVEWKEGAE